MTTFPAAPAPPQEAEIYTQLLTVGGFERIRSLYNSVHREHPNVRFAREAVLEAAVNKVKALHRLGEAVGIAEWNWNQYPASWRAENALAAAYRDNRDSERAARHYENSLRILRNIEAETALAKLKAASSK